MIINPGEISLEDSLKICLETLKSARNHRFMPLTVTVIDVAGVIKVTLGEDGSSKIRADIAYAKAWTSLNFCGSTSALRTSLEKQPRMKAAFIGMQMVGDTSLIPTPGGLLIQKEGKNVGAIGVSGDHSAEDELCAIEVFTMSTECYLSP